MSLEIRECTPEDIAHLATVANPRDRMFHRAAWEVQQTGQGVYLLAWRDGVYAGNATMLLRSKYAHVCQRLGVFPELNGLGASPVGQGIGTALIHETEQRARQRGAARVGVAVGLDNPTARRLYERLGYRDWGHGSVVDRWTERDDRATVVTEHADECAYLTKDSEGRMLKNDEFFWVPNDESNPAALSWSGSRGDFSALWDQTQRRWRYILNKLRQAGVPTPSGRVVEFGSGMGYLDDLLDETCSSIVMLDHTDAYVRQRSHSLTSRCRHVLWSQESLHGLRTDGAPHDWLIFLAVFYHVEDATAAALIRALGRLLRPGGHVLIEGWNTATPDFVREIAVESRLFSGYPRYVISLDLLRDALAPEYRGSCRDDVLVYRKEA